MIHLFISPLFKVIFYYQSNLIFNFRKFTSHILKIISNICNNQRFTDAHTCYKVFDRELFSKLDLREIGFTFYPKITTKISFMNIKIQEVPISYKNRSLRAGKKIRFIDAIRTLVTILKYKFFNNNNT